jgi:ribosomal protein S24E
MNSKLINIVNDPLDFIIWFLYNKKEKSGITKLMKSFQLFTIFDKFKKLGDFKADQFGARDTYLDALVYKYDNILLNIDEEKITQSEEKFDFFKVSLMNQYREKLKEKLEDFVKTKENQDDYNLIKAITYLSDKYNYNEYLRFTYTLFPELTEKSRIKPEILTIHDEIVRNEIIDFLEHLPKNYALEFLKKNLSIIINFSLIQTEFREDLKKILYELLNSENMNSLITEIKEYVLKIIDSVEFINYKIILRNFLDILIENEEGKLNTIEKLHLFKFLILFYYITSKDLTKYYEYWKNSKLKVIFGNEIEDRYE